MMRWNTSLGVTGGAMLVVAYTLLITLADAATKHLAISFEAPQVLMICSALICAFCLAQGASAPGRRALTTGCPGAMAVRAVMTVLASVGFFYAFALLPFAEVFLFIAMVPIFSGLMSAPILGEKVAPATWAALAIGSAGVYLLFPAGLQSVSVGHLIAFGASFSGTLAIVMARHMGRIEQRPLAQVFYPQLAVFVTMAAATPLFWQPMGLVDVALAAGCGLALFAARYLLAVALQELPAYTVTPLINLQFVWMVLIGMVAFSEIPAPNTVIGACIIVGCSLFLVQEQRVRAARALRRVAAPIKAAPVALRSRA